MIRPLCLQKLCLLFVLAALANSCNQTLAKSHPLRERGRTLVEGEGYSRRSEIIENGPKTEPCEGCSGSKNLGYIWRNNWFELDLEIPRMLNYTVSLRVASVEGTELDVSMLNASGQRISLAQVAVPNTGDFQKYTTTQDVMISLPAGTHTLRFKSLMECLNVDYIVFSAGEMDDVVVNRPVTNEGAAINPMKGFNSGWWKNQDYATVGFQYIEWGMFEPEDDVFDWAYVESVLDRAGTKGRHAILQFVVDWDNREPVEENYLGPDWLLEKVGEHTGNADPDDPTSREMRATKYNDPFFVEEAVEAIQALLEHYRDDPRVFVMQVGVLGFWGEWHTFPRDDWGPSMRAKRALLKAYIDNLGEGGLTQVRYPDEPGVAAQPRMGYTNGSATLTDHGYEFGETIARGRLWKNGPVGGEWPPNVKPEHWKDFFLSDKGLAFLEQGHYSTMQPPEPKEIVKVLPTWTADGQFMKMHRRMGYNFQVTEVRHLVSVQGAGHTHIEVDLVNSGIAPFYKDWDVQLAILKTNTGELVDQIQVEVDLRDLQPNGSITLAGTSGEIELPQMDYQIGIRILQPKADQVKNDRWKLKPRNVYVELGNEVDVIDGVWDNRNALKGGWNILDDVEQRQPVQTPTVEGSFFPFEGSFRPAGEVSKR